MKTRWVLLLSVVFGLLLWSIPSVLDWLDARSKQRLLESSYQRFASDSSDTLYVMGETPLIKKIGANRELADRVREVVFTDTDFSMLDISELAQLPNLDQVVIYSSKNCDAAIKSINRLKRLGTLTFADCGLTDAGFDELNNSTLASFGMSAFGQSWTEESIGRLKNRMPECKFEISVQEYQ